MSAPSIAKTFVRIFRAEIEARLQAGRFKPEQTARRAAQRAVADVPAAVPPAPTFKKGESSC